MKPYEKLKSIRKEKGLTTYELSELTGIPQSTISKMENGKRKIETESIQILAKAFNVPVSYFFDEEEEKSEEKTIEKDFPIVPEHFTNPDEARAYVTKHQIFGYGGFNPHIMSDEDILNFANEMIEQAELLGYKYSRKQKK
ncbi:Transcriptional regulator, contains XRE-family HTH domain [Clostridium cadaveris]|uniref:Transcriptional regulator, contains XRE-family HTH domain n=1 Tax=Clostridium cadaveris TaxID=1529 RepID=A0A1I2QFN3_9CLOT|nr:helix-turn-helix transcriptional regulator [Clostridium cadaveris]SFG24391.1 Transcriptional regulator, contains XRE-family HTH domain [Clostridium cadaveris]